MGWYATQPYFLLHVLAVFHTINAELYYEGENQEAIRSFCHPQFTSCFPTQLQLKKLEASMTGTLVWPDDSMNYTIYNQQNNLAFVTYPIVHVICKTIEDIQNAVRFAKEHNLRVTIKSTGHSLWGLSSAHGSFSINLMERKQISVNVVKTDRSEHGEVTVQTGATWAEIYAEVDKHNRLVAGGNSGTVGPGGFLAGGGFGPLAPSLGLGVDNVLEIKVVLADGRVATCTQNKTTIENNGAIETIHNGELFWALRGGGGGTFGIVDQYVLKLHPAPSSIVTALITVPLYQNKSDGILAKHFLDKYAEWERTAPVYWGGSISILPNMMLAYLHKNGPDAGNTKSELQPLYDLELLFHNPSMIKFQIVNHSSIGASMYPEEPNARVFDAGALIPAQNHNESLWNLLVHEMIENKNGYCFLTRLGGQVWNYGHSWSSVHPGFRRAQSYLFCSFMAPTNHELSTFEVQAQQKRNVARFAESIRKFGDGDYINIGYVPSPDWKVNFWGENYVDLLKIKIKYDPDNLFYCHHCVGSDLKYAGDQPAGAAANFAGTGSTLLLMIFALVEFA